MQNFLLKKAFLIGVLIVVCWLVLGIFLFSLEPFNFSWTRGELGDFLNGLGGLALVIIGPTALLQYVQLKEQLNQSTEERMFRTFETLKPEIENLSIRIISKTIAGSADKSDAFGGKKFEDIKTVFQEQDRTICLRYMQKTQIIDLIQHRVEDKDTEVVEALKRFYIMMQLLEGFLEDHSDKSIKQFSGALKSTEMFVTFLALNKNQAIKNKIF